MRIFQCLQKRIRICIVLLSVLNYFAVEAAQQQRIARGVVLDENNQPLQGVRIAEPGTENTTATDADGEFFLNLNRGNEIEVSYVGKKAKTVYVTTDTPIRIQMEPDVTEMDEVVVVGYGVQQKRDLTGAIGSVKASDFAEQPILDINQALSGQVAGVNVMNTSGTPGGGLDIQIRGISTIGSGANPLYVVDGNAIQTGMDSQTNPLSFLNPADIESIEILKDAAAAAIYGSRASNGVVLITTKTGKSGKPVLTYDLKVGQQEVFNRIDVLSGREFAALAIEARNNTWVSQGNNAQDPDGVRPDNLTIGYFQDFLTSGKTGTNWQDAIFRNALFHDHQLAVSGGSERVRYLVSAGFADQHGVIRNTGFKRYSVRANVDATITDRLSVGIKISPTYTNQDFLPAAGRYHDANAGIIQGALLMNPTLDIYDSDTYTGYSMGINQGYGMANVENPVAKVDMLKDWRRNFVFISSGFANYRITDAFNFKVTGATTVRSLRSDRIIPSTLGAYALRPPRDNAITTEQDAIYNWQATAELSYNQQFGKHHISGVAVHERQMQQDNGVYAQSVGTWTDEIITVDGSLSNIQREGSSSISEWALSSWISRVNYNFDDRYLLSGSVRADGSSRFAKQWGVFPSAAIAWRLSSERFLTDVRWLEEFKLRSSYGITGNNSIGNYQYMPFMGGSSYVLGRGGETIVPGVKLNTVGNPDLTWEQTKQFDVGADIALFRRRVSLTVDYYNKETRDLLLELQTPANMGFNSVLTNIGQVRNRGWEFTVDSRNLVSAFKWNTGFNISFNRQKVLALGPEGDPLWGGSIFYANTHRTEIGQPMGLFYGLKVIGVYQNQAQVDALPGINSGVQVARPGEFIFANANDSDDRITVDDRTVIGNPHPDFVFGFKNSFSYRNFSLNVLVRGSIGAEMLNMNFGDTHFMLNANAPASIVNRWQSESNPGDRRTPRVARLERATLGAINSSFVEDASFVNIQNVTLGYEVADQLLSRIGASRLLLQLSVQNLFMFTNYTGYNPEGGINMGATLSPGVDWGRYPLARMYSFGINYSF